ncbi:MAG: MarR family transcriptional regulator [Armatimonadia bacterium]
MQQLNNSTISRAAACGELLMDVVPLLMTIIREEARLIRPADLTHTQFRALSVIDRRDGLSPSELSEMLGLTLSSVSKLMEGLVAQGYVRQEVCPQDRRRAQLHCTPMGHSTMVQARRALAARLAERLSGLTPQAVGVVVAGLRHMQEILAPADPQTVSATPDTD